MNTTELALYMAWHKWDSIIECCEKQRKDIISVLLAQPCALCVIFDECGGCPANKAEICGPSQTVTLYSYFKDALFDEDWINAHKYANRIYELLKGV